MADTTPGIPQDTTPAQDLQINLDEAPKVEEINIPENKTPELNLDLDLNLPEAPKDDDRLKNEDQKNSEAVTETPTEVIQNQETMTEMPITAEPTLLESTPIIEPVTVEPIVEPVPVIVEVPAEIQPVIEPSSIVEEIPSSPGTISWNIPESSSLKDDMKMINELEWHTSAGGLAPEVIIAPQVTPVEAPKTFDLDAMLGNPTVQPTPTMETIQMPQVMPMPVATNMPMQQPAFTIPTTTTQIPVQAVIKTNIPQTSNKSVKTLFFVMMFVALGFTTFFILKTMYPIEFGNMLGGGQTQINQNVTGIDLTNTDLSGTYLSWTELYTGTDLSWATTTWTDLTGTGTSSDQTSGAINTGVHDSAISSGDAAFGELNGLTTTPPATETPAQNDISRLTDYVTQGNYFLAQGKTMGNNTIIKYGLYISKKATTFLENIANGQQINNLSGYFAQFDQYLAELKILVGPTSNPDITGTAPDTSTSSTPTTNDTGMTTDTTALPAQ